jgi:hypothetical protein
MNVAGIEIPSNDPIFLTVVLGIHIPLGLTCAGVGSLRCLAKRGAGAIRRAGRFISGVC